jgi:putative phosphoesterase
MKIGVISDTHLPAEGLVPPKEVRQAFEGVEMILHAGDIYNSECLDWLEEIAPVIGVEVAPAPAIGDKRVSEKRIEIIGGHKVGMVHDLALRGIDEVHPGLLERKFPESPKLYESIERFFGEQVDTIIFGHSHVAVIEHCHGVLFLNPGSPTLPRMRRRLGSVAILDLGPGQHSARLVELVTFRPDGSTHLD